MTNSSLRTRHQWLDLLAKKSAFAADHDFKLKAIDDVYLALGKKMAANKDAFNLANSEVHNDVVAATIDGLAALGVDCNILSKLIMDLTSRNTYGTFCELSGYSFLLKGNHNFNVQVPMTGADILNPNGADLDGVIYLPQEVAFDIKGFGFHEHLVSRLAERLSKDLAPDVVLAQGSWDVPISALFGLLNEKYESLRQELRMKRSAWRGALRLDVRAPASVQMSTRELDPEKLAAENAGYALSYAKQFARNKPFILIFVIHPWFSGTLHHNFSGCMDKFTHAFARLTFCQFEADSRLVFGITMAQAARLLSGILFVNAWAGDPPTGPPRYRLFVNPHATNTLEQSSIEALATPYGGDIVSISVSTKHLPPMGNR
jgi:hypothetical protein